ncbi:MAG: hypothetical protein ACOCNL_09795 [Acetivibrio ethanolgignens]
MLSIKAGQKIYERLEDLCDGDVTRSTADKGRSKENLASYSTDRRAFENWSDGNWITANKLMGFINSNPNMKKEHCANEGNGGHHPRPCSADHIGSISLGFCQRPDCQFLCKPCNSAKNNRMYYSDVPCFVAFSNLSKPLRWHTLRDVLPIASWRNTLYYLHIQFTQRRCVVIENHGSFFSILTFFTILSNNA